MNWKTYESDIEKYFSIKYPGCKISKNVKLPGKLSATAREIDILIDTSVAGYRILIAIECKKWKKKIDVADVGMFIDKLNDVGITKGVMISPKGYSKSAYERAANHFSTQLQVLNFESLPEKCDFWTVVARKHLAVVLVPPNCWLVDANIPEQLKFEVICYMHPFELNLEEAYKKKQLITIQLWPILDKAEMTANLIAAGYDTEEKIKDGLLEMGIDLESELKRQDKVVKKLYPESTINYWEAEINGTKFRLRKINYTEMNYVEFTIGFEVMNHYIYCYSPVPANSAEEGQHRVEFVIQNLRLVKLERDYSEDPFQLLYVLNNLKDPEGQPSMNVHPKTKR